MRKHSKRGLLIGLGLTVALIVVAAAVGVRGEGRKDPNAANAQAFQAIGIDEDSLAEIKILALRGASFANEEEPKDAEIVLTTRRSAVAINGGAWVRSNKASYLIRMSGNFSSSEPGPVGAPSPTGIELTIVLDQKTLDITDYAISPTRTDITKLGTAVPLALSD